MSELLFQLPFFIVATYAFIKKCAWIRLPSIIYGTHTCTTLIPILAEIVLGHSEMSVEKAISGKNVVILLAAYLPYFLIPAMLTIRMLVYDYPSNDRLFTPQRVSELKKE